MSVSDAPASVTSLIGRVGAARASVTVYFLPLVAVGLGALAESRSPRSRCSASPWS